MRVSMNINFITMGTLALCGSACKPIDFNESTMSLSNSKAQKSHSDLDNRERLRATPLASMPNCGTENNADTIKLQLITLKKPLQMQLLQRSAGGSTLTFTALAGLKFDCLESKIEKVGGDVVIPAPWVLLQKTELAPNSQFNGTIKVSDSGWYRVSLRPWANGKAGLVVDLPKIGIGEIFITSGQSNADNCGEVPQKSTTNNVFMWNGTVWLPAVDPLLGGLFCKQGAPWIPMADILASKWNVPIGIAATAYAGTSVDEWQPGGSLYPRIQNAIKQLSANGIRSILWHNGESDSGKKTTANAYIAGMQTIIAATQVDYKKPLPWVIAQASRCAGTNTSTTNETITGAQRSLVNGTTVFAGPNTDVLWTGLRRSDWCHFNDAGLKEHGRLWAEAIMSWKM